MQAQKALQLVERRALAVQPMVNAHVDERPATPLSITTSMHVSATPALSEPTWKRE